MNRNKSKLKSIVIVSGALLFTSCGADEASNKNAEVVQDIIVSEIEGDAEETATSDEAVVPGVDVPASYIALADVMGDLDGDDIDERVIVFETDREGDLGFERELRVYTADDGHWSLWYTAEHAVMPSQGGGTMGDPFESLELSAGHIILNHFGGSASKWSYRHEFKHADDGEWVLSEAVVISYQNCVYNETFTYDLEKDFLYHSRVIETCDGDGQLKEKKIEIEESLTIDKTVARPTLNDFLPGQTMAPILKGAEAPYYY